MSEKRKLSYTIVVDLPEVESNTAVRFCPKCRREIPNHRTLCEQCEAEERRQTAPPANLRTAFPKKISFGKLPQRELLIAGLILGGLILIALLMVCINPPPPSGPQNAHTPVGTLVPVILLRP